MELNVESIKALEPGKIYLLEIAIQHLEQNLVEGIVQVGNDYGIKFIILAAGVAQIVSVPEGMEVTLAEKSSLSELEDLMETELLEFLTNWADAEVRHFTVEQIAELLEKVYLSNEAHEWSHDPEYQTEEWATDFWDWPQNVPEERFLAIAKKWKS